MKISIKQTLGLTAASCVALACSAIAAPPGGAGARGNSSFGMNQRTDLRTGSGNSSFGRTTAENARLRANDADDQDDQDVDLEDQYQTNFRSHRRVMRGAGVFRDCRATRGRWGPR